MNTLVNKRRKKLESNCSVDDDAVQFDDLPEDCKFNILVRLPLESLSTSRFVSKSWYGIVDSTNFRNGHLHRSSRGIIFHTPVENYCPPPKKVFSLDSNSTVTDVHSSFHIKFMEIDKDGKGAIKELNTAFRVEQKIVAACNGLILLQRNISDRRLTLQNPVTREHEDIPMGTTSSVPDGDLYGLAFCNASRRYKILHLFMKNERMSLGCEIMDIIGSGDGRSWRAVDVPLIQRDCFRFLHSPVFAMGALHWIQHVAFDHGECMVSMPLDDEKFKTTAIPPGGDHKNFPFNTVFAMGEFVGLSTRTGESNQIEVWILRGDECGWEMLFIFDASGLGYMTPLVYCDGEDRLVFKCGIDCFYAYDRHSRLLKKIEMFGKWAATRYWTPFAHVNSLVSWTRS